MENVPHKIGLMKKNKYTLGINFLHSDSSACLFKDDLLIAAVEEERFLRSKHTSFFPVNAIKFCLNEAKIVISDIDYITINSNPYSSILKKMFFVLRNPGTLKIAYRSLLNTKKKISLNENIKKIDNKNSFKGKIKYIDHHLSHIASSLYFSNFDKCANISIDGFGDFSSTSWGIYENNKLKITNKIYFPHSLGIFYQSLTQFIGFKSYGDEYKLMGLAPYGKPKYINKINELIKKTNSGFELNLEYFLHHKHNIFEINEQGQFIYKNLFTNKLTNLLGEPRHSNDKVTEYHMDLASSVQKVYEEIFFYLLNKIYDQYKINNLTISGGCGMNSVANGKIKKNTKFENIYICPNPGDAGGSVGSASFFLKNNYHIKPTVKNYAFLGNSYSNEHIKEAIIQKNLDNKFKVELLSDEDLYKETAKLIASAKILGWFQDKMEWGPRALGNRSILADARNKDVRNIINSKIKRRESFRPFAPSILKEHTKEWFEFDNSVPYMSEVYLINSEKRKLIPGVTHVDGTGRLQTVSKESNPRYYKLINEFFILTKVPLILNTSFNENEPIVNKPVEAIDCFERTDMDNLVLGNWLISRH